MHNLSPISLCDEEIIASIRQLVPLGFPEPQNPLLLKQLWRQTADLIAAFQAAGRLQDNPFADAWQRRIHLYETEIRSQIAGETVLVTGGKGCVGSRLLGELSRLGAGRIVCIDQQKMLNGLGLDGVAHYTADVRDYALLEQIFASEKPAIVFHLAAQRDPGLAEIRIRETVTTNIFGTQNIIDLCERFGVRQCVFSSTGKAARYWTSEVYAASKKMAEWLFARAATEGKVTYSMVRFTHMLQNSLVCQQIDEKIKKNRAVNVHAPERYIVAQNVYEAVDLLLNSLVHCVSGRLRFALARNLGWPVETLEVALYRILCSGKTLPIYFQGIPSGYEEPFFMGQVDWSAPSEINTLLNALESPSMSLDASGGMVSCELTDFSPLVLELHLTRLKDLADDRAVEASLLKSQLGEAVRQVAASSFALTPPELLLRLLWWGCSSKRLASQGYAITAHRGIVEVIVPQLHARVDAEVVRCAGLGASEFAELLEILAKLPDIEAHKMHNEVKR